MAWESGAKPVIVLTKTDLCPEFALRVLEVEAIAFGVPVHAISSLTGDGLDLDPRAPRAGPDDRAARLLRRRQVDAREHARRRGAARDADDPRGRRRGPAHDHAPAARRSCPAAGSCSTRPGCASCSSGSRPTGSPRRSGTSRSIAAQCRFSDCAHEHRARLRRPGRARRRHARRSTAGRATTSCSASWRTSSGGSTSGSRPRRSKRWVEGRRGGAREHAREGAPLGRAFAAPGSHGGRERPVRRGVVRCRCRSGCGRASRSTVFESATVGGQRRSLDEAVCANGADEGSLDRAFVRERVDRRPRSGVDRARPRRARRSAHRPGRRDTRPAASAPRSGLRRYSVPSAPSTKTSASPSRSAGLSPAL